MILPKWVGMLHIKCFILFISISYVNSFTCSLHREVLKLGFHRDMNTNVSFSLETGQSTHCDVIIVDHLPSGIYVDPFQMKTLHSEGGPFVHIEEDVDTEKPEHHSQPLTVYMYHNLPSDHKFVQNIHLHGSIPVHLRYHKPDHPHPYVTLKPPDVFLRCDEETQYSDGNVQVPLPCGPTSFTKQPCTWNKIQCQHSGSSNTFEVPVGSNHHLFLVTLVTMIITLFGTALISRTILASKHR